ncbi:MAG: hypothetical protein HKN40_04500 [Winogradskyella sp.]|uniref:hypothetical protein n=1 Tax=Winogradskyella sp. TaxID=1883156 RepID=UPI00185305F8|nr:hypothetical protein [Winogradskyella sp.]
MNFKLSRNNKIGLFFFLAFVISSSLIWLFEERFSKEQWRTEPRQRYKLVDDLIDSQILLDKTKNEVIQTLGEPYLKVNTINDAFIYKLGNPPSFVDAQQEQLFIIFVKQKVAEVTLAVD